MSRRIKIIILLLSIICLLIMATTVAFITREKVANNILTFGNIKMQLLQTTLDKNNMEKCINDDESFDIMHNSTVSRMIRVKNLGKHDFFLRISLKMMGKDKNNNEFDAYNLVTYDINTEDWIYREGWYYYKTIVKQGETTSNLITKIMFDIDNITSNYPNGNFKFDVDAQAVQSENNAKDVLSVEGWPSN